MALTAPTADLTGNTIASTYDQLLILDNADGIVENTLKIVSTQLGRSSLQIDDEKVLIKGVDTSNAAAFEVQQTGGTSIFKVAAGTPALTINAATVTLTQDTDFVTSGGVNGMSIDGTTFSVDGTNNRVGIGTAAPATNLHIYSVADNAPHLLLENFQNADTDDAAIIELYLNDQTTGGIGDNTDVGVIRFTGDEKDGGTKETYAEIRGVAVDPGQTTANKGGISFFVQTAGDLAETLTLNENKVGIGTATPNGELHIHSNPANLILTTTDTAIIDGDDLGNIYFGANDATTSGFTWGAIIRAEAAETWDTDNSSQTPTELQFFTSDDSTSSIAQRMVIDKDGSVGIGTAAPHNKITIANAAGANAPTTVVAANTYLHLGQGEYGASNNGKFMIGFGYVDYTGDDNTHSPAYIGYEETSTTGDTKGDLTFYTRNAATDSAPIQRMIINDDGKVGIGDTSPSAMLDIGAADGVAYFGNSAGDVGDEVCYGWGGQITGTTAQTIGTISCIHSSGGAGAAVLWVEYIAADVSASVSGEHGIFKIFFYRRVGNNNITVRASRMLFAEGNTAFNTSARIDNQTTTDDDDFLESDGECEVSLALSSLTGATHENQSATIGLVNAQTTNLMMKVMGRFARGGDQVNMTFVPDTSFPS